MDNSTRQLSILSQAACMDHEATPSIHSTLLPNHTHTQRALPHGPIPRFIVFISGVMDLSSYNRHSVGRVVTAHGFDVGKVWGREGEYGFRKSCLRVSQPPGKSKLRAPPSFPNTSHPPLCFLSSCSLTYHVRHITHFIFTFCGYHY